MKLAPVEAYADAEWNTPVKKDPFEMPLQPKIDLLLQINDEALKVKGASFVSAFMLFVNEKKFFASTEGSYIDAVADPILSDLLDHRRSIARRTASTSATR